MVMHTAKNSEFAESNPLHCICHQVLGSRQQGLYAYLHLVIYIDLEFCCSTPLGYVNSNAVLWPDIDCIGLLSSHLICTAFTSILKKASHSLQIQKPVSGALILPSKTISANAPSKFRVPFVCLEFVPINEQNSEPNFKSKRD